MKEFYTCGPVIRRVLICIRLAFLSGLLLGWDLIAEPPIRVQKLEMFTGWNLVSIQVGDQPMPVEDFTASFDYPDRIVEIWGYSPGKSIQTPGIWTFHLREPVEDLQNDLVTVESGRGYWIRVAGGAVVGSIEGPAWSGAMSLLPGWNLVGFSGLDLNVGELHPLSAVFEDDFDRIQQVWMFDAVSQRFLGYDETAVPRLEQIDQVDAGLGYWVFLDHSSELEIAPDPFVALIPDADAHPVQARVPYTGDNPIFVGREVAYADPDGTDDAFDLNDNGILDDAETQDTLLFVTSSSTVSITIGNRGNGLVPWELQNQVPWVFTAPPDEQRWPGNEGRPKAAYGTVGVETDSIILYIDRSELAPGRHGPEVISLWVGGEERMIDVLADVPNIAGDWHGLAHTTRVNGREISLGDVPIHLNAFTEVDGSESGGFRAVLDREKSILFPRDVFMEGAFYSGNQFQLTANFEMPAGDRNAPPYASFPGDPDDVDTDGDGRVDVMNPFPFGVHREVTLLGTRVTPDLLTGTYIESIRGMLPPVASRENALIASRNEFISDRFLTTSQPILIEGTFELSRLTTTPTKRSVFDEQRTVLLELGGSATTQRTVAFNVASDAIVQSVSPFLDVFFPSPALLQITLISPDGTEYVIHEFGTEKLPKGTIPIPDRIFGGEDGLGEWSLRIIWNPSTGERGTLRRWGLQIEGVSRHSVTGRVESDGRLLTGVSLRLQGGISGRQFESADGTFTFENLSENDYTIFASAPGFENASVTFFIGEEDLVLTDPIEMTPLPPVSSPVILAEPSVGFAPFESVLMLRTPPDLDFDYVEWDFGDGGDIVAGPPLGGIEGDLFRRSFNFEKPGVYSVKAALSWQGSIVAYPTITIVAQRREADPDGPGVQMLVDAFVGTMGARMDVAAGDATQPPVLTPVDLPGYEELDDVRILVGGEELKMPFAVPSATVYQETKWDVATFDLDRYPDRTDQRNFSPNLEDTNFDGQTYVYLNAGLDRYQTRQRSDTDPVFDVSPGFTTYSIPAGTASPTRFRFGVAIGGHVFSTVPSRVGKFSFFAGRTMPVH